MYLKEFLRYGDGDIRFLDDIYSGLGGGRDVMHPDYPRPMPFDGGIRHFRWVYETEYGWGGQLTWAEFDYIGEPTDTQAINPVHVRVKIGMIFKGEKEVLVEIDGTQFTIQRKFEDSDDGGGEVAERIMKKFEEVNHGHTIRVGRAS